MNRLVPQHGFLALHCLFWACPSRRYQPPCVQTFVIKTIWFIITLVVSCSRPLGDTRQQPSFSNYVRALPSPDLREEMVAGAGLRRVQWE
jgi:hypothetical protein